MTAHLCKEVDPYCYRCELASDEVASIRAENEADAQSAWLEYRNAEVVSRSWADARRVARQLRRGSFIAGFIAGRES